MSLIAATMRMVERAGRPGVLGIVGRRIETRCKRDLASYFLELGRAISKENLAKLATGDTLPGRHTAEITLARLTRLHTPQLYNVLVANYYEAMIAADKMDIYFTEAATPKLTDIDKVGLSGQAAADYAAKHAAEQVTEINRTTQKQIADAIATGIEDRLGVPGLGRLIRSTTDDMSVYRSQMIASTEMNDAMSEAALQKMGRLGIGYKQIILSDDACPICEDNADEDPLPVEAAYSSGELRPPFHPNCRCAIAGARPPEETN